MLAKKGEKIMKILSKNEMEELLGQCIDIIQDSQICSEKIITGKGYDKLTEKFRNLFYQWGLVNDLDSELEEEEWNTPTD